MAFCQGSFRALFLYDVAEEIVLDEVRKVLGVAPAKREPVFKQAAPQYVRFEQTPIVENAGPVKTVEGELFEARLRYFDIGVISVELEAPINADWSDLIRLSSRWTGSTELEEKAATLAKERLDRIRPALQRPYSQWLDEDYHVILLTSVCDQDGCALSADRMLANHGTQIAQIIRGELLPLSEAETKEVLSSRMSFYPSDVLVVGWMSALVYDTPENATPMIQLVEYANVQLLEYRRYDDLLGQVLKQAYSSLERRRTLAWRWRLNEKAEKLNTLRLDIMELTERTDNALKFLSDMFYARAFQMTTAKVGVNDYRSIVDEKLKTGGELYEYMVSKFRDARMFLLEFLIVLILVIDLIFLFRGK